MHRCATVFVFATLQEARPFIDSSGALQLMQLPYPVYRSNNPKASAAFLILICGMGLEDAYQAVDYVITRYMPIRIINCGVVGSLKDGLEVGDVVQIKAVTDVTGLNDPRGAEFIDNASGLYLPLPGCLPVARLASRAEPVFDVAKRAEVASIADLIDMEAAAVATACVERNASYAILKVVSDHATDREILLQNLRHASRRLAHFLTFYLNVLLHPETIDYEPKASRSA